MTGTGVKNRLRWFEPKQVMGGDPQPHTVAFEDDGIDITAKGAGPARFYPVGRDQTAYHIARALFEAAGASATLTIARRWTPGREATTTMTVEHGKRKATVASRAGTVTIHGIDEPIPFPAYNALDQVAYRDRVRRLIRQPWRDIQPPLPKPLPNMPAYYDRHSIAFSGADAMAFDLAKELAQNFTGSNPSSVTSSISMTLREAGTPANPRLATTYTFGVKAAKCFISIDGEKAVLRAGGKKAEPQEFPLTEDTDGALNADAKAAIVSAWSTAIGLDTQQEHDPDPDGSEAEM